jgi:hypothetical protein
METTLQIFVTLICIKVRQLISVVCIIKVYLLLDHTCGGPNPLRRAAIAAEARILLAAGDPHGDTSLKTAYQNELLNLPDEVAAALRTKKEMASKLSKRRKRLFARVPNNLEELADVIPDSLKFITSKNIVPGGQDIQNVFYQDFLSVPNPLEGNRMEHMLIYSTAPFLRKLLRETTVSGDGTFRTAPKRYKALVALFTSGIFL